MAYNLKRIFLWKKFSNDEKYKKKISKNILLKKIKIFLFLPLSQRD